MRELEPEHEAALARCTRRTTLSITLGEGTELPLSTSDVEVGETLYLGKLAPVDALNLELTEATEGINLQIENVQMTLGQDLINTPEILSGSSAILGCYFKDLTTGDEWHDVKMEGKVRVGKITRQWVNIFFESIDSAVVYNGVSIASLFPDAEIPTAEMPVATEAPLPAYNDLENVQNSGVLSKLSPLLDSNQYAFRHFMPDFERSFDLQAY